MSGVGAGWEGGCMVMWYGWVGGQVGMGWG